MIIKSSPAAQLLTFVSTLVFAPVFASTAIASGPAATPTTAHEFRIQKQWSLGGAGGWGLPSLDPAAHRLYIPRSNRVMVVDTTTGTLVAEIGGMKNLREMALDDSGKYGYVTDPTDGTAGFVRVFDRDTHTLVASVPTGLVPAAIAFDPTSKSVLAFNSHSHSVTVIDAATNQVSSTIPLPGRPAAAVADGTGNVYVTLPAQGQILRINVAQKEISATWTLTPCTGPARLALDPAHHQLFTTCEDHRLVTVDIATGHVAAIGNAPTGSGDLNYDPKHNLLFLANGDGTLTVFRRGPAAHFEMLQQVKTQPGARTLIVDHADDRAYLMTSKFSMNTTGVSEELQYRPTPVPDTFSVIVVGR